MEAGQLEWNAVDHNYLCSQGSEGLSKGSAKGDEKKLVSATPSLLEEVVEIEDDSTS